MIRSKFAKGDAFVIKGETYEFTRRLPDGRVEMEHLDTGARTAKTDLEIAEGVAEGVAVICPDVMRHRKGIEVKRSDFGAYDENIKQDARRKLGYLKRLAMKGITTYRRKETLAAIKVIAEEIGDPTPPSYAAVCKWRKLAGPAMNILNLIDKRHFKEGQLNLHIDVREIVDRNISEHYMSYERPTIQSTYDLICAEIDDTNRTRDDGDLLKLPSYHAVRDAIYRIDEYSMVAARFSKEAAKARFDAVGAGPIATHPLAVAELDHTKLDLMVVDDKNYLPLGRPWIVFLVDRCTRMPLGMCISFDPPSVQTVAQCLKNAFLPKSYVKESYPDIRNEWPCYGVPTWIVFDRAMENLGKDLEDMASVLGFHVQFCPRQQPWYKGRIERFLGTMNRKVTQKIPGKTFSNIPARGDYNPANTATITYDELLKLIHMWLIDDYMQAPHRGLNDVPAKVWAREIPHHPVRPLPDRAHLEASLGRVEMRVLSKKGIEFENLFYSSPDVVGWRSDRKFQKCSEAARTGHKVQIKYDPTDISKIKVLDPRNQTYVEVPCIDQEYSSGLSLWQHRAIKTHLRDRLELNVDESGLRIARAEMQAEVDAILNTRRGRRPTSTAAIAARFTGIGRTAPAGSIGPVGPGTKQSKPHPGRQASGKPGREKSRSNVKPKSFPAVVLPPSMSSDDVDVYADKS